MDAGIATPMGAAKADGARAGEMARRSWLSDQPGEEAGSVARPYTITRGRTRPVNDEEIEVEALVWTTSLAASSPNMASVHWRAVADLCQEVMSLAEVAARLGVPIGVARVLIGDMAAAGLVYLQRPRRASDDPDIGLLERVLYGLRQL
jgi:Protein of unknown function (DUF742)